MTEIIICPHPESNPDVLYAVLRVDRKQEEGSKHARHTVGNEETVKPPDENGFYLQDILMK